VFLIGGPAFSGTTLLALLLNQGDIVCLDEPDFHNPEQSHRGIPFLNRLFPDKSFPERPTETLSYEKAVHLIGECERSISPCRLGIKTCGQLFLAYAKVYKPSGYPVIALVRDIRDALARPLPDWLTEEKLNKGYRLVWDNLDMFDLWLRYEDLVSDPAATMAKISKVLGHRLDALSTWDPEKIHSPMLKLDRHDLLKSGSISASRVHVWRTSGKTFSEETHHTARLMGY
jgi:hypothetical protein